MSRHQTIPTLDDDWEGVPYRANPDCPVCKGAGFIHIRDGERVIYSDMKPCPAPGCMRDSIHGKQPREVQRQTFETFQAVPGTEKALKAAWALAYGGAKFIWLLFYGQPGNGKTHLGNAIVKVVRERGLDVRMVLAADLFSMLREAIESKKADVLLRKFKDIFFLVIDDYGVEYGSDWESAKFDELMTSRYATGKPTVLITNKKLSELPERIQSRFQDKVMARAIHNSASDYRGKKR
ncbi:Chromosomal replication initiator protein DnaA [subsurface metagenome]